MTRDNASFWKCDNCGYINDARDIFCENCKRGVRPEHSEIDDFLASTTIREFGRVRNKMGLVQSGGFSPGFRR